MAEFVRGLVQDVQNHYPPVAEFSAQQLAQVLNVWLLAAHSTPGGAALFVMGHRCNHSCDPTAFYTVSDTGELVFRAQRPLAEGDAVEFSYLYGYELTAPCFLRRQWLEARKCFVCGCPRCVAEAGGQEPGRSLPCAACNGGQTAPTRSRGETSSWLCSSCANEAPPSAALIEQVRDANQIYALALLQDISFQPDANRSPRSTAHGCHSALLTSCPALQEQTLVAAVQASTPDPAVLAMPGWDRHWVAGETRWRTGVAELRGGVEGGDFARARSAFPAVAAYFAWARACWPEKPHFVAMRAAECYACLAAMGTPDAKLLVSRLCLPYIAALENEYGTDDRHNIELRRLCKISCGQCGEPARSCCSQCKMVGYCSVKCQKVAWKVHKPLCLAMRRKKKD